MEPLNCTVEEVIKLVPLTVIVNPESPALAEVGEMLIVVGTGLSEVTVNV